MSGRLTEALGSVASVKHATESRILRLEQEVAASNLQVSNLKDQQEAWIQRKNEFESERKGHLQRLDDLERSLASVKEMNASNEKEKNALTHQVENLRAALEGKAIASKTSDDKVAQLVEKLNEANLHVTELEGEKAQMTRVHDTLTRRVKAAEEACAAAEKVADDSITRMQGLSKAGDENIVLKKQVEEMSGRLTEALDSLAVSEAKAIHLEGVVAAQQFRLQESSNSSPSAIASQESRRAALLGEYEDSIKGLEDQRRRCEETIRTLREEMTNNCLAASESFTKAQASFETQLAELSAGKLQLHETCCELRLQIEEEKSAQKRLKVENDSLVKAKEFEIRRSAEEVANLNQELSRIKDNFEVLRESIAEKEAVAANKAAEEKEAGIAQLQREVMRLTAAAETQEHNAQLEVSAEKAALQKELSVQLHLASVALDKANSDVERLTLDVQRLHGDLDREREWKNKHDALLPEVERLTSELTTIKASVETWTQRERRAAELEWKNQVEDLKFKHQDALVKLANELRDKMYVQSQEHLEAIRRKDVECKEKILEHNRESDEKIAQAQKEYRDQLRQDKIKLEESYASTEKELLEKAELARGRGLQLLQQVLEYKEERDELKVELERFTKLPNPVGIGIELKYEHNPIETDVGVSDVVIAGLVPGLSADLCGSIRPGMYLLAVDQQSVAHMPIEDINERLYGKRGSRVSLALADLSSVSQAAPKKNNHTQLQVILKRGAWGPDHCIVEPEDLDMIDSGAWPDMNYKDRFTKDACRSEVPLGSKELGTTLQMVAEKLEEWQAAETGVHL